MKKWSLLFCFILIVSTSFAQPGGGQPLKYTPDHHEVDSLRKTFLTLFDPALFYVFQDERGICATLKDSILPYGMISAYNISDSMGRYHPAFKDLWTTYTIQIRFLSRVNEAEKKKINRYNDSLLHLMNELPKKLGILHCDIGKDMYYGRTEEDKKRVKQYENEKQILYNHIIPLPLFSAQYVDVYVADDQVFDGYHQHPEWKGYYLCPEHANTLRWKIWDRIKEIQKKFER